MLTKLNFRYTILLIILWCAPSLNCKAQLINIDNHKIKVSKISVELKNGDKIKSFIVRVDSAGLYVIKGKRFIKKQILNDCSDCTYIKFDQIDKLSILKRKNKFGRIVGVALGTAGFIVYSSSTNKLSDPIQLGPIISAGLGYGIGYAFGTSPFGVDKSYVNPIIKERLTLISADYIFETKIYKLTHGEYAYINQFKEGIFHHFLRYKIAIKGQQKFIIGHIRNINESTIQITPIVKSKKINSIENDSPNIEIKIRDIISVDLFED